MEMESYKTSHNSTINLDSNLLALLRLENK